MSTAAVGCVLDCRALNQCMDPATVQALHQQYQSLDLNSPNESCLPPGTKSKCRYVNVLPNPESRVPLSKLPSDDSPAGTSTFINANFVAGYNGKPRKYIASQGPLPHTVPDFWRMVWEHGVEVIVMTTGCVEGGRVKCHRYWPESDQGSVMRMPPEVGLNITVVSEERPVEEYMVTVMTIEDAKSGEKREIRHFWYLGWPDHGAPQESMGVVKFLSAVNEYSYRSDKPVIVHCSAGIGRTGTFMAIDLGMQELQSEWRVTDIVSIVQKMREDRGGTVQTFVQYRFIHMALRDYITPGHPSSMFGANKPRVVTLTTGAKYGYWGYHIRGSHPVFILSVDKGGLAEAEGVMEGDFILEVNGRDTSKSSHDEVVQLMRQGGPTVTMKLISKAPSTFWNPAKEEK